MYLNQLGLNMPVTWSLQEKPKTFRSQSYDEGSQLSSFSLMICQLNRTPWTEETVLLSSILYPNFSSHTFSRTTSTTGSFPEHFFHQDTRKNRIFVKGGIQQKGNIFISWQPEQQARRVSRERRKFPAPILQGISLMLLFLVVGVFFFSSVTCKE